MAEWNDSLKSWDDEISVWNAERYEHEVLMGLGSSLTIVGGFLIKLSSKFSSGTFFENFNNARMPNEVSYKFGAALNSILQWVYYGDVKFGIYTTWDYSVGNLYYIELIVESYAGLKEPPEYTLRIEKSVEFESSTGLLHDYDITFRELVEFSCETDYTFYTISWGREVPVEGDWVPENTVTGSWVSEKPVLDN